MAASTAAASMGGGPSQELTNVRDAMKGKPLAGQAIKAAQGGMLSGVGSVVAGGANAAVVGGGAMAQGGGGSDHTHPEFAQLDAAIQGGDGGGAAKDTSKSFGGMGGGMFDFMRTTSNKNKQARAAANVAASGMPYKMPASGKHNNSPIDMNFGSKEHRGFGHNKPVETPLEMKSFGVGSLTGGVAAKGRSKTGAGGKFNN